MRATATIILVIFSLGLIKAQDIDTDDMFEALAAKRGKLSSVQVD